MFKELIYKWFGVNETCRTCEVLEHELEIVRREKELLLNKLLEPRIETRAPESVISEEFKPVPSGRRRFIPAIVRQQMMDQNDQLSLQLMKKHKKELNETRIEELEKELGVEDASQISKTV